jgi:hypothetical protein
MLYVSGPGAPGTEAALSNTPWTRHSHIPHLYCTANTNTAANSLPHRQY